ncbi:hypothetical protein AAVH_25849 [Aphelenchoides avenae]|nr:hypothetical protein AAVH_25849 [Aphelenchus avenae]
MVCPAIVAVLALVVRQVSCNTAVNTHGNANDTDPDTTTSYEYSYEGLLDAHEGNEHTNGDSVDMYGDTLPPFDAYSSDDGNGNGDYYSGDTYDNGWETWIAKSPGDDNLSSDIAKKIEEFFSHASQPEKTFLKRVIKHVYKHLQGGDS